MMMFRQINEFINGNTVNEITASVCNHTCTVTIHRVETEDGQRRELEVEIDLFDDEIEQIIYILQNAKQRIKTNGEDNAGNVRPLGDNKLHPGRGNEWKR